MLLYTDVLGQLIIWFLLFVYYASLGISSFDYRLTSIEKKSLHRKYMLLIQFNTDQILLSNSSALLNSFPYNLIDFNGISTQQGDFMPKV